MELVLLVVSLGLGFLVGGTRCPAWLVPAAFAAIGVAVCVAISVAAEVSCGGCNRGMVMVATIAVAFDWIFATAVYAGGTALGQALNNVGRKPTYR